MQHILETAARLVRNPERALLYGVYLPEYLSLSEPLSTACFLDQRGKSLSLLPSLLMSQKSAGELPLAVAAAVC